MWGAEMTCVGGIAREGKDRTSKERHDVDRRLSGGGKYHMASEAKNAISSKTAKIVKLSGYGQETE
jgi:hypothetical protein